MSKTKPTTTKQQLPWWVFAALLGVLSILRFSAVFVTRDDPVFQVPYLDAAFYHFWALSLASGTGGFADAFFLGPLYPHALSWLYRLGAGDLLQVRLVQTSLGLINVAVVFHLGSRLFGQRTGTVAAVLLALFGSMFFYEGLLVMESLLVTLVLAGGTSLLLSAIASRYRTAMIAAAALLLGLATLGRGTVLLLVPVAIGIVWTGRVPPAPPEVRSTRLHASLLVILWGLVLLPAVIHNSRHGAYWAITTNAGVNFYAGNNPESNGRFRQPPGVQFFTETPQIDSGRGLPPAIVRRALTVEAVAGTAQAADSGYWFARSWEWIRTDTLGFAALLLRKAGLVLQGREIGQIESPAYHRQRLPVLQLFWVGWSVILPLSVLGIWGGWRNRRTRKATRMLFAVSVALLLPGVLFFVTARYRLVAVPFLCVLAGGGVSMLVSMWQENRRRFVGWIVLLLLLASLTRLGAQPAQAAAGWENAQMAERLYVLGDLQEAIVYQEKAAQLLPRRMETRLNLALYWSERAAPGDLQRAEQVLRSLVVQFPDRPILLFNWASLLEQTGNRLEARRVYRRTLELDPDFAPARQNLRAYEQR